MSTVSALLFVLLAATKVSTAYTDVPPGNWEELRSEAARLYEAKSLPEAEGLLRQALEIARGDEARLVSLRELGMVCERSRKYADAREFFREAISIQERSSDPPINELAMTLNYLGVVERESGQFQAAVKAHSRALSFLTAQSSPKPRILATTHLGIAMAQDGLDASQLAQFHYKKALELSEDGQGLEGNGLFRVLIRLGRLSAENTHHEEAGQFVRRAEKILKEAQPEESPEWISYLDTLAALRFYQGKYSDAERHWKRAYEIGVKHLGPEDPNVLTMLVRLGELHMMLGEYKPAIEVLTECLAVRERILGSADPDIALVLTHLGVIHIRKDEYVKAATLLQRAIEALKGSPGRRSLHMALALSAMGELYAAQGSWNEAAKAYEESLHLREGILGQNHPAVMDTVWSYAEALAKCKRKKEADVYRDRVRAVLESSQAAIRNRGHIVDVRALQAEER